MQDRGWAFPILAVFLGLLYIITQEHNQRVQEFKTLEGQLNQLTAKEGGLTTSITQCPIGAFLARSSIGVWTCVAFPKAETTGKNSSAITGDGNTVTIH